MTRAPSGRRILRYTFGNHMHWVDMEWLWGYHVLPGSVRDMLAFCDASGARGNVNFDGVGFEKLAVEDPEAFAALRSAVAEGRIEIVGGSYGQPYGLFHGGEANVRQRVYGVRTALRLFGTRPRTFWEEEFDFFPQLPQLLAGAGYAYASLFFQWTWHTPELPLEEAPAVWWIGQDGSRLLTAPRGPLNLHQWPEDVEDVLSGPLPAQLAMPIVLQWLELMPSPDWMCRSELLLPQLERLAARDDLELRFGTLSQHLEDARHHAVERRYTLDDVYHGVSLGKNGDGFRRLSRRAEHTLLDAESLSVLAGRFGRPYPGWDVYPTWELEEAWRELLAAQHHDNDECEGLCGHVGAASYRRSLALARHVRTRTSRALAARAAGPAGRTVVVNALPWRRPAVVAGQPGGRPRAVELPAAGYVVLRGDEPEAPATTAFHRDGEVVLRRAGTEVRVDATTGRVRRLVTAAAPEGPWEPCDLLGDLRMRVDGRVETFPEIGVELVPRAFAGFTEGLGDADAPWVRIRRRGASGAELEIGMALAPEREALDVRIRATALPRPDPGVAGALRLRVAELGDLTMLHDHPYGVSEIHARGHYRRKYPSGDWMTSPQWFEEVEGPFTALQFVDIGDRQRGLLWQHDGSQAFVREGDRVEQILTLYDPWDEDYFVDSLDVRLRLAPRGALSHAERWRRAQEFERPPLIERPAGPGGDLPWSFESLRADAPGVVLTAAFRETEEAGRALAEYAGAGMGYPIVLRLVEFDGHHADVSLRVRGAVAKALRANLMGETAATIEPRSESDGSSTLALRLRPFEIATVVLDLREARKQVRDLDARRDVWARAHRDPGAPPAPPAEAAGATEAGGATGAADATEAAGASATDRAGAGRQP